MGYNERDRGRSMEIRILQLLDGARQARGLTVIIDVFRAFSLEAYLYGQGAECTLPVSSLEQAYELKKAHPEYLLAGERKGAICPGFDFGNSPSAIAGRDFSGKTVVHTTSAGTQGVAAASGADEILGGALVNAEATARYIISRHPEEVSLVCMGWEGLKKTEEDLLCAEYLRALLQGRPMPDLDQRCEQLRYQEGRKFFDPAQASVFPEADFWMCIRHDIFPFAIQIGQKDGLFSTARVEVRDD